MNAKDFKDFLKVAKKHNKGNTIPICDNLLFNGETVSMYNINNDVWVTMFVKEPFTTPFLIDLIKFDKIINKLGASGTVDFQVDGKNIQLHTNKGDFTFEPGQDIDDFPEYKQLFDYETTLSPNETQIVKRLSAYVSNDDLRPMITNVLIDANNIVATDAHVLAYPKAEQTRDNKILIPGYIAKELFQDGADISIYKESDNKKYVRILQPAFNIAITYREIEGKFPAWENVLPGETPNSFEVEGKELLNTLEVGSINAGAGNKFIFETLESSVKISTGDADLKCGFSTEIASKNVEGGMIAFSNDILSNILKTEKMDKVNLCFSDPHRAAVINGYVLIMPMAI